MEGSKAFTLVVCPFSTKRAVQNPYASRASLNPASLPLPFFVRFALAVRLTAQKIMNRGRDRIRLQPATMSDPDDNVGGSPKVHIGRAVSILFYPPRTGRTDVCV
jgi:hypothetical protein